MENGRFKQLYQLKERLYAEGGPVIIEKGALLLDTKFNKLLIQLKFYNIAENPFKALYISFNTYDTSNEQLLPVEYKYLDIEVDYGKSFGMDKAIILENNLVRSFEISKYSVVYEDNEIQTFSNPFLQLPDSDLLQTKFKDEELVKQYCIETSKYSKYVPIQYKGIWKCACGKWNSKNVCWNCKEIKGDIFRKLTDPRLITNKEARLEQERINKELQEAQRIKEKQEEKDKEKKQKEKNKNIIIASVIGIVGCICIIFGVYSYIHKPVKPSVTQSTVEGLEKPLKCYPGSYYGFDVIGAGMENQNPHNGDVRWVPIYWSLSSDPSETEKNTNWKIGTDTGIEDARTFGMYVFFQKNSYKNGNWVKEDDIEKVKYEFKTSSLSE